MQFTVTLRPSTTHVNEFGDTLTDWDLGVIPSFWSADSRRTTSSRAALQPCLYMPELVMFPSKEHAFNHIVLEWAQNRDYH